MMKTTDKDIDILSPLLEDAIGFKLTYDKKYLVESRLSTLARKLKIDVDDIYFQIRNMTLSNEMFTHIISTMMTYETYWFREYNQLLLSVERLKIDNRPLKIWSAGCSTGEEPFSISMLLKHFDENLWKNCKILGTDVTQYSLSMARSGEYSDLGTLRCPIEYLNILKKNSKSDSGYLRLNDDIKNSVLFKIHKLISNTSQIGAVDIIYIKNVLYYMTDEKKDIVLNNLKQNMIPEKTWLVLSNSETMMNYPEFKRHVNPNCSGYYYTL